MREWRIREVAHIGADGARYEYMSAFCFFLIRNPVDVCDVRRISAMVL